MINISLPMQANLLLILNTYINDFYYGVINQSPKKSRLSGNRNLEP